MLSHWAVKIDMHGAYVMEKLFKKAVIVICLPIALNIAITVYCFYNTSIPQFKGYFIGTILGMFFSFLWIFIARKALTSNIMVMFTVSLASFPVKIVFLAVIAFGGLFLLGMDQFFFGMSFLIGTFLSLFVEVWFLISANRIIQKNKKHLKASPGAGNATSP
jgi:hypothetical protein